MTEFLSLTTQKQFDVNNNSSEATRFWKRSLNPNRYILLLAAAWTLAVSVSLTWSYFHERDSARQTASVAARREFAKDVIYRRWNAGHGGVYVPVSESTPPNPYLAHVEEREIETPSGRRLTLVNPAYMTRQVHELGSETAGVRGHITSFDPIRPANAPDAWEKRALETFERGEREFSSVEMFDGEAHLRLMRPLTTEKGCLKCHAEQGYKEGDVRGGISVSMPMAPYAEIARENMTIIGVGHVALWLLGLASLVFGTRHIQQHARERDRAHEALRVSEERFRFLAENMADIVWTLDLDFRTTYVSPSIKKVLGFTPEERKLQTLEEMVTPESLQRLTAMFLEELRRDAEQDIDPERHVTVEVEYYHAGGHTVWLENSVKPLRDNAGEFAGMYGSSRDITNRKRTEERIEGLNRLNEDLLGSGSLAEKMKRITDGVVDILGADFARIWLTKQGDMCDSGCMHAKLSEGPHVCRDRNRCLYLVASSGRYTHIDGETHRRVPFGCYKIGRVAAANEPGFLTNDVAHDPRVHNHDWARELGLVSFAGYRLVSQEESPIGVLALFSKQALSPSEEALLQTIASTASEVILASKSVEALRESEQHFRDLAELLPQTVCEVDLEGRLTFVNRNAFEMFGYSQEDLEAGLSNLDMLAPEDRERARRNMECIVGGENSGGNEYVAQRKDGSRFPIVIYSAPIVRQNRPAGLRGIIVDITDRKRAEEALRVSEERFQQVAANALEWIWEVGADGLYTYASPPVKKILGYRPAELVAKKHFYDLFHSEDREELKTAAFEVFAQKQSFREFTNRNMHKDGHTVWLSTSGVPILRDDGTFLGYRGADTDITDRKRLEEEKLALERQVQHAQKLESLGVLAGGIAHDFNNLLMAILGNADLALHELSPMSPARGNLQAIEEASKRAADLAKQMLAYSGKGRFVVEPIDVGELVEETAHLLEVSISKKAVLKYQLAENLPTFDGDVTQIRQVVMNLITNASEAIGERSGVIALSTGAMDCDRAYLDDINEVLRASLDEPLPAGIYTYFEVADTGYGMDADTIDKIFDPFFTTKFAGRGLGMSAVLGIVRGHKGALKIHSQLGKGTTFKVLFPANELPDGGIAIRGKDDAEGKDWRGSGSVLLADDEEVVCAVGKQMLERLGFSVLTAPDGREALKVFGEHADEIVCVLLDLTMPHLDGEETFREMRRLYPGVRVILCSGYNEQDATQRFAGKGLAAFIQKPFNLAGLKEKLMAALAAGEGEP